jgi:hypothetical protein
MSSEKRIAARREKPLSRENRAKALRRCPKLKCFRRRLMGRNSEEEERYGTGSCRDSRRNLVRGVVSSG